MTTQVWRVVCEGGEVHAVGVAPMGGGDYVAMSGNDADSASALCESARLAVATLANELDWPVVEIVAPGAQTSEERMAQVTAERDAYARMMAQDAEALGIDHAGDIPGAIRALMSRCDDADAAVRLLTTERDAAHASHAALAAAVREEREARAAMMRAGDGWMGTLSTQGLAERARHDMAAKRVVALLSGAPAGYVSAEVVRGYLRAVDEPTWDERSLVALDAARTALDAALAAEGGGA